MNKKRCSYVKVDEINRKQIKILQKYNTDDKKILCKLKERLVELSRVVDEYCNTKFLPTSDNFFTDFNNEFTLRKTPLLKINKIYVGNCPLTERKDFYVYIEKNRVELNYDLPKDVCFKKSVEVKYEFGFLETPQTVKDVIIDLLVLEDGFNTGAGYSNIQSESWDSEYSYQNHSGKDNTLAELRKNILERLDPFVQQPYVEAKRDGNVRVMVI